MDKYNIPKIINNSAKLQDIRNDYEKTQQLLQEQRWCELNHHIAYIVTKYPIEVAIHNLVNPHMPNNIEQNAINCMKFLENLFKAELGVYVTDVIKYLSK